MAQPPNPANLKVKFASFKGKSKKDDPNGHVAQFNTKWVASGLDALYGDDVKKQQFAATLEGKAMNWYSQYGTAYFVDTTILTNSFLSRFWKWKTLTNILKWLKSMKRKSLLVEDFAQKFLGLNQRLAANERPTNEMLGEYFCKELRKNLRTTIASTDIAPETRGSNGFVTVARRVEKRLGTKSSKKRHKEDNDLEEEIDSNSESSFDSNNDSEASESDTNSNSKDSDTEKKKKKKREKTSEEE